MSYGLKTKTGMLIAGVLSLSVGLSGCSGRPYTMKEVDALKADCEANKGMFVLSYGFRLNVEAYYAYCKRDGMLYSYPKPKGG